MILPFTNKLWNLEKILSFCLRIPFSHCQREKNGKGRRRRKKGEWEETIQNTLGRVGEKKFVQSKPSSFFPLPPSFPWECVCGEPKTRIYHLRWWESGGWKEFEKKGEGERGREPDSPLIIYACMNLLSPAMHTHTCSLFPRRSERESIFNVRFVRQVAQGDGRRTEGEKKRNMFFFRRRLAVGKRKLRKTLMFF